MRLPQELDAALIAPGACRSRGPPWLTLLYGLDARRCIRATRSACAPWGWQTRHAARRPAVRFTQQRCLVCACPQETAGALLFSDHCGLLLHDL